jgi:hypothetical protein
MKVSGTLLFALTPHPRTPHPCAGDICGTPDQCRQVVETAEPFREALSERGVLLVALPAYGSGAADAADVPPLKDTDLRCCTEALASCSAGGEHTHDARALPLHVTPLHGSVLRSTGASPNHARGAGRTTCWSFDMSSLRGNMLGRNRRQPMAQSRDSRSQPKHCTTVASGAGGGRRRCACGSGPSGSTSSCRPAARRRTRGYTWACAWTAACAPAVGALANWPLSGCPTQSLLSLLLQADAAVWWCMCVCIWVLGTCCLQVTSERNGLRCWHGLAAICQVDLVVANSRLFVGMQARGRRRGTSLSGS